MQNEITSPTLQQLDEKRRPQPEAVCATCQQSLWFITKNQVKCYCRAMFAVTWSTEEPIAITACDGKKEGGSE